MYDRYVDSLARTKRLQRLQVADQMPTFLSDNRFILTFQLYLSIFSVKSRHRKLGLASSVFAAN